jgi:hypothetical protein
MIFKNMNLYWLTCIQEFGFVLQVVNMTCFHNYSKERFGFEFELEPRYNDDYVVEVL